MPDFMDMVQQRQQERLSQQINAARKRDGVSAMVCKDCDQPIPAARRAAFLGVTRCLTCQEIAELKNKHYTKAVV